MIKLFYNTVDKKLFISEESNTNCIEVMRPFARTDSSNKYYCDIIVPDSQFSFKIETRYKKSYSHLRLFYCGKALIKMSDLMHMSSARKLSSIEDMSDILVKISSEDNLSEWKQVFEIIVNAFNNFSTWQVNETYIMIDELKELMAESELYKLTWQDAPSNHIEYKGLELKILKAQKLMEAISMINNAEMENLWRIQGEIIKISSEMLPMLKKCYLLDLNDNEQLNVEVTESLKQKETSDAAIKHSDEYIAFMLSNKFSSTTEQAKKRFSNKYPEEAKLVDNHTEIVNTYYEKISKHKKIYEYRNIIECSIETIMKFLKDNGRFDIFLNSI